MIAVCQICRSLIVSRDVVPTLGADLEAIALQNFDLLAGHVLNHLTTDHPPNARESMAVMHLTAKVYAMTFAESESKNFSALRSAWRKAILAALSQASDQAEASDPDASAAGGGNSSSELPSGLNEKKSERNFST